MRLLKDASAQLRISGYFTELRMHYARDSWVRWLLGRLVGLFAARLTPMSAGGRVGGSAPTPTVVRRANAFSVIVVAAAAAAVVPATVVVVVV